MLLLQCLFSIQPPLNFTIINYQSSISSTLASQIIAQNESFSSPFATAAYCLNVTSLAIWSARLSPPVRYNQALNYENISRKNRQRVCFTSVSLSLDICLRRPMSFMVIPSWNSALNWATALYFHRTELNDMCIKHRTDTDAQTHREIPRLLRNPTRRFVFEPIPVSLGFDDKVALVKVSVPRPRFSRVLIIPPVLHTHSNTTENHFV